MLLQPMVSRLKARRDLPSMLDTMVRDVVALHGAEFGDVQLVGDDGYLWIVSHSGLTRAFLEAAARLSPDAGTVCARALRERGTVVVDDVTLDRQFAPFLKLATGTGFRAVLSSALVSSGGVAVGVVSVHFANPKVPTGLELTTLESYCRQAADLLVSKETEKGLAAKTPALSRALLDVASA